MRTIYPKLITTLFLVLFAAMLLKYADADNKSAATHGETADIAKTSHQ